MSDKKAKTIISAIIISASTLIISSGLICYYICSRDNVEINSSDGEFSYSQICYEVSGRQISKKAPGAKILIITERQRPGDTRSPELLKSFKRGLAENASVVAIETPDFTWPADKPKPTPKELLEMISLMDFAKAEDFDRIIDRHPECNIVVTFIGLPFDCENMRLWFVDQARRPKLVLLNTQVHSLKSKFKSGDILCAVTPKPDATYDDSLPRRTKLMTAFDRGYMIITPDNVEQISKKYNKMFSEPEEPKKDQEK